MPYPNFHSGRVKSPALFSRIVVLKTLSNGIMIYGGPLKSNPGGGTTAQAYRFPRTKFTVSEARKWLKDHNIKYISFEKATGKTQAFNVQLFMRPIRSFSQDKIIELIPQHIYDKIIEKDPHPFFAVYSICHEGISSPIILGTDEKPKKISWPRKAIQSIKNIYLKGVKLFKGHNKDNSHSGRRVIGRVIHSFQKEIEGKLHHMVVTYHSPKVRDEVKDLNVCSQEGEWNFFELAGQLIADSIEKLTGIALANDKEQTPAFAEAKRFGYIQAFDSFGKSGSGQGGIYMAKKKQPTDQDVDNIFDQNDDLDTDQQQDNDGDQSQPQFDPQEYQEFLDFQKFQKFQKQQNGRKQRRNDYPYYPPYQDFQRNRNRDDIDRQKQKPDNKTLTYEQLKKEAIRMKVMPSQLFSVDDLKADREFNPFFNELEMAKEDLEKQNRTIEELMREKELGTAEGRIKTLIGDEKLPEPIFNFILSQFEKDKENIEDLTDQGLKTFVKQKTELFQETAKIVNPEYDIKKNSGDNKTQGDVNDYTKAAGNELLDEDVE